MYIERLRMPDRVPAPEHHLELILRCNKPLVKLQNPQVI